ncbi:MAG TPA: hypothetical protein PKB13_04275 [Clostridia bacterium]|nr:hypothetical protein [Clostridia bacterium]
MNADKIVKDLRCCASGNCNGCSAEYAHDTSECNAIKIAAATLIEAKAANQDGRVVVLDEKQRLQCAREQGR